MTIIYSTGTITLTNGSKSVIGTNTAWQTMTVASGIIFPEAEGNTLPFEDVVSDTEITAGIAWTGESGTYAYALVRDTSHKAQVITNAEAVGRILVGIEQGTVFRYDEVGDTAGRATFNARPKRFGYLDISVNPARFWVKASNNDGDWAGPFVYARGETGPAASLTFSPVTTGVPGTPASAVTTGTGPYNIALTIPAGEIGVRWRGAYSAGTSYLARDGVLSNGSAWIAKQDTIGNAPPVLPTTENAFFELMAAKGADGTGTGDVVGPAGVNAGRLAVFAGTNGKQIAEGPATTAFASSTQGAKADSAVQSIVAGANITVDLTNPHSPVIATTGGGDFAAMQAHWMASNIEIAELASMPLLIGMDSGNGVFDGFNSLVYVNVAGATGLDTSEAGKLKPISSTSTTWSDTLDRNSVGWPNYNIRLRIGNSLISTSGTQVRLRLRGPSSGAALAVDALTIGHKAASGDEYDFATTPTAVTVGGSASFTVGVNAEVLTDWITFALDETKDLIVAAHTVSGDLRTKSGGSSATLDVWSKAGASEATTANVAGYSQAGSADMALVDRIEVGSGVSAMTVTSVNINLSEAPEWGRVTAIVMPNGAGVNSDIIFSLSRNGSVYVTPTMVEQFSRADGSIYVDSGIVDMTAIASGTAARWRIQTLNGKAPKILAVAAAFGVS